MDYSVELKVNGQVIPLNPFVRKVYLNTVRGLVDSLDKIPEKKETIELVIREK